ncbi:MAG TPA: hypothetical protein VD902_02345, partial [Symbiobacteriaceae bacterium]|nr:hypothetical protein [Symbiobacteriaceae bacterium]
NRLQNLEAQHLLAALQATSAGLAAQEAEAFLQVRTERRAYWAGRLGQAEAEALLEWERLYEWLEGLARYIQIKAQPEESVLVEAIGRPVDPVAARERVYTMGAGQALVLDLLQPGWQLEAERGVALDLLIQRAIAPSFCLL